MAMAGLLVGGGINAGIALAQGPGPNGHNNHGLCTAYYNGSPKGQEQKHKAGPFAELERQANEQGDPNASTADNVAAFCDGLVGGNPGVRS
jgi:hypothetical protein